VKERYWFIFYGTEMAIWWNLVNPLTVHGFRNVRLRNENQLNQKFRLEVIRVATFRSNYSFTKYDTKDNLSENNFARRIYIICVAAISN